MSEELCKKSSAEEAMEKIRHIKQYIKEIDPLYCAWVLEELDEIAQLCEQLHKDCCIMQQGLKIVRESCVDPRTAEEATAYKVSNDAIVSTSDYPLPDAN